MTHPRVLPIDQRHEPTSPKRPWLSFSSDWRGDALLATCSLAARGLLVEMMCLMHSAEPYGHLLVNGAPPSDAELARLVRATSVSELRRVRQELLSHGVLSLTDEGVVYSRRLVRDEQNAAKKRENGKLGGNPWLKSGAAVVQLWVQLTTTPLRLTAMPTRTVDAMLTTTLTRGLSPIFQKPYSRPPNPQREKAMTMRSLNERQRSRKVSSDLCRVPVWRAISAQARPRLPRRATTRLSASR